MTTKDILLVTNYFPPEKGAAANRMESLAYALKNAAYHVHVVCPFPNYPSGTVFKDFRGKLYQKTEMEGMVIHRLWVWPSNSSNKVVRLLSMLSFAVSLKLFFLLKKLPKKILIQYSPVFVGFTAVFWSWCFQKRIILNISDLWPLAGLEMGLLKKGFYYSILEKMERFCYRKAHLILGQSEEILQHVAVLEPKKKSFLYRNIPDFSVPEISENDGKSTISLVYAGLLGLAQGVKAICEKITFPEHVTFHIYGSGPEANSIKNASYNQVIYHGEISRAALHSVISCYDMAFIPLTSRIYGSVPSKIFEYTRLGLPVLYFAGGEGGDLVRDHELGWVIPVNNIQELQSFIDSLSFETLQKHPKTAVQESSVSAFQFNKQIEALIQAIEAV
ncbi:glycosyltransferase family 4 protein [Altibacter lentus]|uniref:glycosyltransferase family 4 protein n=1 Tax=Altibacter lentus TaxID=1223410 RepID=UPI00054E03BA|nr:glycosyltransferase family 4 protein [Altibacter lentus]